MIHLADTWDQIEINASNLLLARPTILGFDTETTIGRRENPTAASIIQLATNEDSYIFQIYNIYQKYGKLPGKLVKILENPTIVKVGIDLTGDIIALEFYGIKAKGMIDAQLIARTMNLTDLSLNGLGKRFISGFIEKEKLDHTWNWDHDLTAEQVGYAGYDAFHPIYIYQGILKGVNISTPKVVVDLVKDEYNFLNWVKHNLPIKYDSLINKTANSYGPWVKRYTKIGRENRARLFLDKFLAEGIIRLNQQNQLL